MNGQSKFVLNTKGEMIMNPKELLSLLKRRISCRDFSSQPIEGDKIELLLEAAILAPTSCNRQSVFFVILPITDARHSLLAKANCGGVGFAKCAPLLILVLVDERTYNYPEEKNFPVSDGTLAAGNMMIMAPELGLGSCWISWQASKTMKSKIYSELKIPNYYLPICVLAIGYPASKLEPIPREKVGYYRLPL